MKRLLVLVILGALLLAACGGSDDDNDALAGKNTGNASAGNDNGNDNGDDGDSEYQELLAKAKNANLKVTYEFSTSEGTEGQVVTVSSNGEGKLAYFADDGDTHLITDGEEFTSCSDVKSEPECNTVSGGLAATGIAAYTTLLGLPATALSNYTGSFANDSTETIAGREARCVSFNYLGGEWKSCSDKETGIGLLWEASSGGQGGGFKATEVTEPSDSDFEPDATPTEVTVPDISDMTLPGGGTIPGIGG
jgi:hypothetical protein